MIGLRDALYKKIRNSNLMVYDIKQYESWMEGDPRRTYQHLINVIERHIARVREDKHVAAREKYARDFAGGGKPTATYAYSSSTSLMLMPKPRQKQLLRRKQLRSPGQSLKPLLYYHHLNRNSMPKGKGQGRKGKSKS